MANTSNHNWEIPDVNGSKDVWGQILNDFFDDELDRQVKLEGTFADRPAAGSSTVKYYHATDRRIVYYNDGNTWEAVYGLGTDSNPVPGTSHFESISTGSVNTDSTDSGEYLLNGNETQEWELVTRQTDVSNIDVSTDTYQEVKIIARGSGNNATVTATINGMTSAYEGITISDSGVSSFSSASAWNLFDVPSFGSARGEYIISIRPSEGDRASIAGNAGSYITASERLVSGGIDNPNAHVDSVQVSIPSGSLDEVEVWGDAQ